MRSLLLIIAALMAIGVQSGIRELEERAEQGDATAISLLRDSAQEGSTRAMNYLGYLYWQGRGTRCLQDSALYFLRKAADLGDAKAIGNLGHLYLIGSEKLPADTAEGMRLLNEAIAKKNIAALRELKDILDKTESYDTLCSGGIKAVADAYSHGYPFRYDYHKSVEMYNRAALAGDSVSMRIMDELLQLFPDFLKKSAPDR